MKYPIAENIPFQDPLHYFAAFHDKSWCIFLDSGCCASESGRYSFIGIDPFLTITSKNSEINISNQIQHGNPFTVLQSLLKEYQLDSHPGLPPFQGGAAGHFAYDLRHHLEILPRVAQDEFDFLDMGIGFYDVVLAFDLVEQKAWIISSGLPEKDEEKRHKRALERLNEVKTQLKPAKEDVQNIQVTNIRSNFTDETYGSAVQKVIDYIYEGDVFEANISQRFSTDLPKDVHPFQLYRRLREINPAPYAAYLQYDDEVIASASPEQFLHVKDGQVTTRPIKGTRPRHANPKIDTALADELKKSEKDRAENIMIVDLMRNDLSKVCESDSVHVPKLCALESFATVHHLVSTVTGQLKTDYDPIDLLKATFPGGSITGAPKIRAMEIIEEIEPTCRGPYCGSAAYIGFDGCMDSSILIRTYAIKNNTVTYQAGGAIVSDSRPASEYEETLHKAHALTKALQGGV